MKYLLTATVILMASMAHAQTGVIDATGAKPGTYHLKVTVAADGSIRTTQVKDVIHLSGSPQPEPDPPNPDGLTQRALEVKAAADAVSGDPGRIATCHKLADLLGELAVSGQDDGTLRTTVQIVIPLALTQLGVQAQWSEFIALMTRQVDACGQCDLMLKDAVAGLNASAGKQAYYYDANYKALDLQKILKVVACFVDAFKSELPGELEQKSILVPSPARIPPKTSPRSIDVDP